MRALLLLLAPLLLAGCALVGTPPPAGGVEYHGYTLVCEDVEATECRDRADVIAVESVPAGHEVRWIAVRPDGADWCWDEIDPRAPSCMGDIRSVE